MHFPFSPVHVTCSTYLILHDSIISLNCAFFSSIFLPPVSYIHTFFPAPSKKTPSVQCSPYFKRSSFKPTQKQINFMVLCVILRDYTQQLTRHLFYLPVVCMNVLLYPDTVSCFYGQLYELQISQFQNIIVMITSKGIRQTKRFCMKDENINYRPTTARQEHLKEKDGLEDLNANGRIILKIISKI